MAARSLRRSPSLPGELYANFRVLGILGGFWLLGACMKAGHRMASRGGPAAVMLYAYACLVAIHVVEGGIASKIEFLLLDLAPAWLAIRPSQLPAARAAVPRGWAPAPGVPAGPLEGMAR